MKGDVFGAERAFGDGGATAVVDRWGGSILQAGVTLTLGRYRRLRARFVYARDPKRIMLSSAWSLIESASAATMPGRRGRALCVFFDRRGDDACGVPSGCGVTRRRALGRIADSGPEVAVSSRYRHRRAAGRGGAETVILGSAVGSRQAAGEALGAG